jgi:hypothetical protein
MLTTPILLLIFNRPEPTAKVFETIRKARPKQLFVAADGPRLHKEGEFKKCEAARKIATNVDWDCEVKTLFRNENKGCGIAVSEAITWFFEEVEQGIILEDDILPDNSFFKFCDELLEKYKDDPAVMTIGGYKRLDSTFTTSESYFFTGYPISWGWATWRRAWKNYDFTIASWASKKQQKLIRQNYSKAQFLYFKDVFDMVCNKNEIDTWDFQWLYCIVANKGMGIVPAVNLVKNIGYGADATHTFIASEDITNTIVSEISFPLIQPNKKSINKAYDKQMAKKHFSKPLIAERISNKLKHIIQRFSKRQGK